MQCYFHSAYKSYYTSFNSWLVWLVFCLTVPHWSLKIILRKRDFYWNMIKIIVKSFCFGGCWMLEVCYVSSVKLFSSSLKHFLKRLNKWDAFGSGVLIISYFISIVNSNICVWVLIFCYLSRGVQTGWFACPGSGTVWVVQRLGQRLVSPVSRWPSEDVTLWIAWLSRI